MGHNPDIYLLYEYMNKVSFAIRIKVHLDERVDEALLKEAAQEAFARFPYFSVQVGLDSEENYTLEHNDRPLAVLPEKNKRFLLGSEEVNKHLFVITYRDDEIWFSCSHSVCGGFGVMFWVKSTLYQYMCKKYGPMEPPVDVKLPGTPVTAEETFFPDAAALPEDEPIFRYNGGDCNIAIGRVLKFLLNPFVQNNYYYEIEIPSKEMMDYARSIDASPNTLIAAMMYKAVARLFEKKEAPFISGRIAADYRDDIGASKSYRDFVRFIHVKYDKDTKDESVKKLNMRTRGAVISQNQPELSYERFRRLVQVHNEIDKQPTLKEKIKYAKANSTYRSDPRDAYTVSYVGELHLGEMEQHIKGIYNLTDGDLMLEVNALKDKFCICFQLADKNREPLECFLSVLEGEGIPYKVSDIQTRYIPKIKL